MPKKDSKTAPQSTRTARWGLRVTYKMANLDGWNEAFLQNRQAQLDAGIDVFKVTWKRRKSMYGKFAYKATIVARVIDRARAEAFMKEPKWQLLARSGQVEMEMSTITNAWHPLRD